MGRGGVQGGDGEIAVGIHCIYTAVKFAHGDVCEAV